jgi:hypothetical protein
MVAYEYMSDRGRLKYGTERIEQCLVDTAVKIDRRFSLMARCRVNPSTTPTDKMPIRVFTDCGSII